MERKETWRDDAICRVRPQEHEADFTVGGERSVDATDRNNNLTPCSLARVSGTGGPYLRIDFLSLWK